MKENLLLNVDHLTVTGSFNKKTLTLIDDINFYIFNNQIVGLVGESGSGKTLTMLSVMRMLPKNIKITSGAISLLNRDISVISETEMKKIRGNIMAMIFQSQKPSLSPFFKISSQMKDILKPHIKLRGNLLNDFCLTLLCDMGFDNPKVVFNKYPFEISGGMLQRVMLALALAIKPKLLIADEPITALDPINQSKLLFKIKQSQSNLKNSLIIVTHDFSIVKKICDYVIVIKNGKIIEQGQVKNILNNPQNNYTHNLIASALGQ